MKKALIAFLWMALPGHLLLQPTAARAQVTAFTYQGRLQTNGSPATGLYDVSFTLFTAATAGSLAAGPVTNYATPVTNGLFVTLVDFGPGVFTGAAGWLELAVSPSGAGNFTPLAPRQPVTPVPNALYANAAGSVLGPVSTSQLTGSIPAATLTGQLTLSQLPAAVVTNGESGVLIAGTFSGSGAGLTNVPASAIVSPPLGSVLISAGGFTMGNTLDADLTNAAPVGVTVSACYFDQNPVTFSVWQGVVFWATNHGYSFVNPGLGKAPNHPVQSVDWYDCVKWCNARSERAGRAPVYYTDPGLGAGTVFRTGEVPVFANWSATGYRLPTEAEWEKAARGGLTGLRFPWGNQINGILANYLGSTNTFAYDSGPAGFNSVGGVGGTAPATSPPGTFAANAYGLNDMAGNVSQWCWDWYAVPYAGGTDPRGPAVGAAKVQRGGNANTNAAVARTANRASAAASSTNFAVGFRTVVTAIP